MTSIVLETSAKTSTFVVKISPEISKYRFAFFFFSMTVRASCKFKDSAIVSLFVTCLLMLYDTCPA